MQNIKSHIKRSVHGALAAMLIAANLTALGVFMETTYAAPVCVNDVQGANDEPGQKDLTRFCEDTGSISWNWDELSVSGMGQSLDACALFDTDGDGFANKSLCVSTQDGDPFDTIIYTCAADNRVDRCAGADTGNPATSTCSLAVTATQPFAAGSGTPNDLTASCAPSASDTSGGDLIDVCSYPSGQPNSDPSDCVIFKAKTAKIEVRKVLDPTTDPGLFDLKINGVTYADNIGNGGTTGEVVVDAGNVTVLEAENAPTDLASYTTTLVCKDQNGTGATLLSTSPAGADTRQGIFTAVDGQDIVCIFTNTRQMGGLIVEKIVDNGNTGATATADDFSFQIDGGTVTSFEADGSNSYSYPSGTNIGTITETAVSGYTTTRSNCDNITIVAGQTQTCTITNTAIAPTLTLLKTVVNNNGGTATEANFQPNIDGNATTWGVATPVTVGSHTATETVLAGGQGYQASNWGTNCATNGTITLALGENATCTITNDDIAPVIVINKVVFNPYGGPTLTPDSFLLTIDGNAITSGTEYTTYNAGSHIIGETQQPGYEFGSFTGQNCTIQNSVMTAFAIIGGRTECTITNNAIQPKLTLVKVIDGPQYGDTSTPDDFGLTVDGNPVTSGATNGYNVGSHAINETGKAGYVFDHISGTDCPTMLGGNVDLELGDDITCTIHNTAVAPTLTIKKHVVNDNGGTASVSDFGIDLNGSAPTFGAGVTNGSTTTYTATPSVLANQPYTLSELDIAGYSEGQWSCTNNATGQNLSVDFTLSLGEDVTCEITNDDIAPTLTIKKHVVNDNLGTSVVSYFGITLDGQSVVFGPGVYDAATQTMTYTAVTNPSANANLTLSELDTAGYDEGTWVCSNNATSKGLDVSFTLDLAENVTCEITNNDIPPVVVTPPTLPETNGTGIQALLTTVFGVIIATLAATVAIRSLRTTGANQ